MLRNLLAATAAVVTGTARGAVDLIIDGAVTISVAAHSVAPGAVHLVEVETAGCTADGEPAYPAADRIDAPPG